MGIPLCFWIAVGNMDFLTMLVLTIHKHEISSHFFVLFLIMLCNFHCIDPSDSLLNLFLYYAILREQIWS